MLISLHKISEETIKKFKLTVKKNQITMNEIQFNKNTKINSKIVHEVFRKY